jgi:hypothetical protein
MDDPPRVDLRSLMERAEAAAPVGIVDAVATGLLEMLGAHEVSFLIADFSGRTLSRLGHAATGDGHDRETRERVELKGTPHGRALAGQEAVLLHEGASTRVLAPVTSRGEAVGVLELVLPFDPHPTTLEDVALAAHQLAYLVIANRRFTDLYEWGQRTVPLSLAAEIQRRLLPATYTCEAGQFTLAGWLEPAGQVGGDTFDFSLDRDALHLSITDAMGHSVSSALLATLVVASLRNTRRRFAFRRSTRIGRSSRMPPPAGSSPASSSGSTSSRNGPGSSTRATRRPIGSAADAPSRSSWRRIFRWERSTPRRGPPGTCRSSPATGSSS